MSNIKEIYFLIIYQREKTATNNDIKFDKKVIIQNIHSEKTEKNKNQFEYMMVFRYVPKEEKNDTTIDFTIDKEKHTIKFENKAKTFIYDVSLTKKDTFTGRVKAIDQTKISNWVKFNIYYSAITSGNGSNEALSSLYKDSINLYKKKPSLELLINIFIKTYTDLNICSPLLKEFKSNLEKSVEQKSEIGSEKLKKYKDVFQEIYDKSDKILKNNTEISPSYYGLILCFLNNYDFQKFTELINHLYSQDSDTLFQILLTYKSYLKKEIKIDEKIMDEFISYTTGQTATELNQAISIYLKKLKLFLQIIDNNKEKIISMEKFKPLDLNNLENTLESKDVNELVVKLNNLIEFSEKNKKLLINFTDKLWEKLINFCSTSTKENIILLSDIRNCFKKYFVLVESLFKKDDKIYKNISAFNNKDKFDLLLDKNIKEYLKKTEYITNSEIINLIMKKDPIYEDKNHINKRDCNILNKLDLENIEDEFITEYRSFNFEIVFQKDINRYLTVLFDKVKHWDNLDSIFRLINEENLKKLKQESNLMKLLDNTYDKLVKDKNLNFVKLPENELNKAIEIISEIADFMYLHNNDFYSKKIIKIEEKIRNKIYIHLIKFCKDEQHNKMKENIKDYYLAKLNIENLDEFILFIKCIKSTDDYYEIMEKIKNQYLIKESDFYSPKENISIILPCKLIKNDLIDEAEENIYYQELIQILEGFYTDIDGKTIKIKYLKSLFECKNENYIKDKLDLFSLLKQHNFEQNELYNTLKGYYDEVNNKLEDLKNISNNLGLYYSRYYKDDIEGMQGIIKIIENGTYQDYSDKLTDIKTLSAKKELSNEIDKVKKCKNIFEILYRNTKGDDELQHFKNAQEKLKNLSQILNSHDKENKKILEEFKKNNTQVDEEIKKYFEEQKLENDFSLVVNFDSYKKDIESIFYFFDNLYNEENWNQILLPKYKNFSQENVIQYLKELKEKKIYDYEHEGKNKSFYIKFFNCLNNKDQAFDFLNQKHDNLNLLYDKLDVINQSITSKDIDDTISCVEVFKEIKNCENHQKRFDFIKEKFKGNKELLKSFENFSEIYSSVIELNRNFDDFSLNLYSEVEKIVKYMEIIFSQTYEEINLKEKNEKIKIINDLLELKNKIHIKSKFNESNSKKEEKIIKKYKTLSFFKEAVNNIGIIYEYLTILRTKGSVLPIRIKVVIKEDEPEEENKIKYFLNDKNDKEVRKTFEQIEKYLTNAKTDLIKQLETFYQINDYMRFFYGRQITNIVSHLEGYTEIFPFLRYILNDTSNKSINEGNKSNPHDTKDYIGNYNLYDKEAYQNICNYVSSLLKNNNSSLEKNYQNMEIKNGKKLNGIYFYKSISESMEEDILQIFLDKIGKLPIAQNILITNKETYSEEMQAFLYRAILCSYNTIFVIEINKSFSDYQQRYLNKFIDKIISYKLRRSNIDKKKTSKYMDSCLIFLYNEKTESSLSYIAKLLEPKILELETTHNLNETNNLNNSKIDDLNSSRNHLCKNVHVVKSEICGLGKTEKIKKEIAKNDKKYIHFPIGGNITRNKLYIKIKNILDKIEKEKLKYEKVAIHLDLYEVNEPSILNEFLFSFLITKFYSDSENIIYIQKDIEIYVEIPNCFEDMLSIYKVLNSFDIETITINNKPKLDLPEEKLIHFENMINTRDNEKIKEEINKYIKFDEYSYSQISIFINIFISQYSKTNNKRTFYDGGKDVTNEVIKNFAKCTKYFTSGAFANLLTGKNAMENLKGKKPEEILGKIYEDDLANQDFDAPLIFRNPKENQTSYYYNLYIKNDYIGFDKNCTFQEEQPSSYYLDILKEILELKTSVEKLQEIIDKDKYVITNDNFRKMVLILYRIVVSDIPVILMGETGCGKTTLIRKLNQLINDGKENLKIINIHPGITDDILIDTMQKINKEAGKLNDNLWVFFDELNTCDSLSLLTEIFINRSFQGTKLAKNIKILGACNPYRLRDQTKVRCGLVHPDSINDNRVYLVKLLPQSLMYYVFNFGSINDKDEEKYIKSIISDNFTKEEGVLKEKTKDLIAECHKFLRENKFDPSEVSLREISRFSLCLKFFQNNYFKKKNEFLAKSGNPSSEKIKAIIISVYICYYIRLTEKEKRINFDTKIQDKIVDLVNWNSKNKSEIKREDLLIKIKNEEFINDIKQSSKRFKHFSDILLYEQDFILDQIELGKGIGHSNSLKENLFLLFVALCTNIPLIIIGKPGSGKSLSSQLICKSMRGKYSPNKFFKSYPSIIQSYFQGADTTSPEDVLNIFTIAEKKLDSFKSKDEGTVPISMLLFDELGLAERSKSNPLKVLHSKLDEYFSEYNKTKNNSTKVCFIGITNWGLDAAKLNRAFSLSVPDLDENIDDLEETSITIAQSYNEYFAEKNNKNEQKENEENNKDNIETPKNKIQVFEKLLPHSYYNYKKALKDLKLLIAKKTYDLKFKGNNKKLDIIKNEKEFQEILMNEKKINIDFHGNRDFFYLIKGVAKKLSETNEIDDAKSVVEAIEKYIERNFGGMDIEIDINENDIEQLNSSFVSYLIEKNKNEKKISSVKFFKSIYNSFIESDENYKNIYKDYIIKQTGKYEILNSIYDNIYDENNSRYLLLIIKPSLSYLIQRNIEKKLKLSNTTKELYFLEGSPFINDQGSEYQYRKLNEIQELAKDERGNLLVLQNLKSVYPFLYDMFNMNYTVKDGKNYARICHGNYTDQLACINKSFRMIIIVNKKTVDKLESPFLSRFEKININSEELLTDTQKKLSEDLINNECDFDGIIKKIKNPLKYNIKDLIIGCKKTDIQAMVYCLTHEQDIDIKNEEQVKKIKENVIKKIVKLLPQDFIVNLEEGDDIKKEYFNNKKIYNIEDYIRNKEPYHRISIIYTFNNCADDFPFLENYGESIFISEIQSEFELKKRINITIANYKKLIKKKKIIYLRFQQSNFQYLSFIVRELTNFIKDENIDFICIIHIKRNFEKKEKDNKKGNDEEKIYNIPNLDNEIEQLFLDNLKNLNEGEENEKNKINLNTILNTPVNKILEYINLDKEFMKVLRSFINNSLGNDTKTLKGENDSINHENYLIQLEEYFNNNPSFMNDIIDKAKSFINFKGDNLVKEVYKNSYINQNSVDIISIVLEFIRNKLISEYIKDILQNLEDNNFFTSLLVTNSQKEEGISSEIIEDLKKISLDNLKYKEKNYDLKFDLNYFIPGLYNIYNKISNLISKNYADNFMKNEKKLRNYLEDSKKNASKKSGKIENKEDTLDNFKNKENELIDRLEEELEKEENKIISEILNIIKSEEPIFLNDYITFYLDKYYYNNKDTNNINNSCYLSHGDINHKIMKYLLKLRFKEDNEDNENNYKLILKKLLWIESNINYIIDVLEIYKELKQNFVEEDKLFIISNNIINESRIKYITDEDINPEITTIVNECYYLLLASFIYSILPPNIDIKKKKSLQISVYIDSLKDSLKIIKSLDDNLKTNLYEMYIIDEFLEIYKVLESNNKGDLSLLNDILEILRKNCEIIQLKDDNYSEDLKKNLNDLYEKITKNLNYADKDYFSLLKNIFYKETKKIQDIDYRTEIFLKLKEENEIIKYSCDILQMLLDNLIKPEKKLYEKSIKNILNDKSEIIQIMENILKNPENKNYFTLTETLLYFFEKNSCIYLNKIMKEKNKEKKVITLDDEEEVLKIFKNSITNLEEYNNEKKNKDKNKNISKLFSISYIKVYCYNFIQILQNEEKEKINEPKNIINVINESKILYKIITLYIYKIIYNFNDRDPFIFSVEEFIKKFKLKEYKCFKDFKISPDNNIISDQFNLNKDYESIYDLIEKFKFEKFKNVNIEELKSEEIDKNIDKFYFATSNLILSNLKQKGFDKELYAAFYKNVCTNLFKSSSISKAIKIFFDPNKFEKIKLQINNELLTILLNSYRYCLNEINSNSKNSIFNLFYDRNKLKDIKKYFYPGNDIQNKPIYDILIKIEKHLKEKQKQACFICMCKDGYYYSTRDGEPNDKDLNNKCPLCDEPIGSKKDRLRTVPIKRDNYFRIVTKEENERKKNTKFNDYDFMTLDEFKEKYIDENYLEEKGISEIDENHMKKDDKIVRDLTNISYRVLNFILYSHLLFGKLFTEDDKTFDEYLPKNMTWEKLMTLIWQLLKNELNNNGINNTELFMNFIFNDIFKILNENTNIKQYQTLKKIEKTLNMTIMDKIELFKKEYKNQMNKNDENIDKENKHFIYNLLIEKYRDLDVEEYPFYSNFFYSNYISEEYLLELVKLFDKDKYPVLLKNLENKIEKKDKKDKNGISLTKLKDFNGVLNLINEEYSYQKSKEEAEKTNLEDEVIYRDNIEIFDNFFKFYNGLKIKSEKSKILKLDNKNKLIDFFVDENTSYGKSFIETYQKFIKKQNDDLSKILDVKIEKGIFDKNCKKRINIQNINDNEIFALKLPKDFSFNNIAFDYSIRKTLIDNDYKSYNQFIIDYDSIEEIMTELLLKNKKLLNDNIIQFVYINEDLNFNNSDVIFKYNETPGIQPITLDDKIVLYEFYDNHHEDINLFINIIHDFIQLMMFINNNRNDNKIKDKISGKKEISNVFEFLDDKIFEESDEFKSIFENNKNLTINKISNLFVFYLRLIFYTKIKDEFVNYQISEKIEDKKENKIKKYFTNDKLLINQEAFRSAIRLLITLYLYIENNKEEKIKKNNNNLAKYLNLKDIWVNTRMEKKEFKEELKDIKKLNIKLNEIIHVYNLINNDKDDDEKYLEDVRKEYNIKKKEKENIVENSDKEDESEKSDKDDDDNKSDNDDDNKSDNDDDNKSDNDDDNKSDNDDDNKSDNDDDNKSDD